MKRLTVQIALIISTITLFSGCCKESINIPQKCIVPYTDEPKIFMGICENGDNGCVVEKVLRNYDAMKDYAMRLKINSEVCR